MDAYSNSYYHKKNSNGNLINEIYRNCHCEPETGKSKYLMGFANTFKFYIGPNIEAKDSMVHEPVV